MKKYIVYTDGACSNNQSESERIGAYAAAIFTEFNGKTYKKEVGAAVEGATNNQMELKGVIEALKTIVEIDPSDMPEVTIYSDSQYVVKGVTLWLQGWKANGWKTGGNDDVKNKEMWTDLDNLLAKVSCKFEKVKGDGNDKWNNHCDVLARKLCGSKPKRK